MLHTFTSSQLLHTNLQTLWDFMSSPNNLSAITPAYLRFEILSEQADIKQMYQGQIIEYYVRPVWGIQLHWVTEITHIEENVFFVDEQRFGPYAFWHHKHYLKPVEGGVEMTDVLHYKLPYGFIGKIINALYVKKKIREIFDYRQSKLEELFNLKYETNHELKDRVAR